MDKLVGFGFVIDLVRKRNSELYRSEQVTVFGFLFS